jgi:hypothetical protein
LVSRNRCQSYSKELKSTRLRDEIEQNQHLDELLTSSFGWNSSLKVRSQSEFAGGQ